MVDGRARWSRRQRISLSNPVVVLHRKRQTPRDMASSYSLVERMPRSETIHLVIADTINLEGLIQSFLDFQSLAL